MISHPLCRSSNGSVFTFESLSLKIQKSCSSFEGIISKNKAVQGNVYYKSSIQNTHLKTSLERSCYLHTLCLEGPVIQTLLSQEKQCSYFKITVIFLNFYLLPEGQHFISSKPLNISTCSKALNLKTSHYQNLGWLKQATLLLKYQAKIKGLCFDISC